MGRHSILQVGFWATIVGRSEQHLIYLLAWKSLSAIRILPSIGEVCGPMRVNPEQLAVRYYCDDLGFESFRELLSTRSKRAMTALR
jgi:hypothetical protein